MLLNTDGVINSRNPQGAHFGIEKIMEEIQGMNNQDTREVVTKLLAIIRNYEGGSAQSDDISMLAFRYIYKTKNQASNLVFCFIDVRYYSFSFSFGLVDIILILIFSVFFSKPTEMVSPSTTEALMITSAISSSRYF